MNNLSIDFCTCSEYTYMYMWIVLIEYNVNIYNGK